MTTFIVLLIMVAVFFCGRYSILIPMHKKVEQTVAAFSTKFIKENFPSKIILDMKTGSLSFDKEPLFPITVEFAEDIEFLEELLKDDNVPEDVKTTINEILAEKSPH